jgi:hypothetical protein
VRSRGAPPVVRPCGTTPPDLPIRRARDLRRRERRVTLEVEFADKPKVAGERAHGTDQADEYHQEPRQVLAPAAESGSAVQELIVRPRLDHSKS